jgi:hypothetical protein
MVLMCQSHDVAFAGAVLDEERKARHAEWHVANMAVLRASGVPFTERPTACLFRETGKPKVDFFPHTGRWVIVGTPGGTKRANRQTTGGAAKFLAWYAKQ